LVAAPLCESLCLSHLKRSDLNDQGNLLKHDREKGKQRGLDAPPSGEARAAVRQGNPHLLKGLAQML